MTATNTIVAEAALRTILAVADLVQARAAIVVDPNGLDPSSDVFAALIALGSLPLAWPIVRIVHAGGNPRKLNGALFHTAQLHMRFGALMAAGLGLNWVIKSF